MNYPGIAGQFPKEFPEGRVRYVYLDWDNKVAEFLPGVFVPLAAVSGNSRRGARRARTLQHGPAGTLRGQFGPA
jgi:hypothetical protein